MFSKKIVGVAFLLVLATIPVVSQYPISYPNCPPATASDFETTYLFTHTSRNESSVKHDGVRSLIRFDLLKNGDDYDVYFGGFEGVLYRYNSQNKQITAIKDFQTIQGSVGSPFNGGDHGVTGVAFHPNFEVNRWLFVFYTPMVASNQNRVMRLSRFEMNQQFQLVNEKILLSMEATTTDMWHSGGDMYFAANGDLFLQVGDNVADDSRNDDKTKNAAWTSGNTTNLIGGTTRIHPDSSDVGYSIPKDNFGEYFAPLENEPGYMDTSRVKPELFVKGSRSNFTATGHPTELIHIWGEVSTASAYDEVNVINKPVYGGWPHFQGNPSSNWFGGSTKRYPHDFNDDPVLSDVVAGNLVGSSAIQTLPKVYPADMVMGGAFNIVMAQALYYYGKGDSIWNGRTFPPHFHETFMFSQYGGGNARIVPIIKSGNDVTAEMKDNSYGVNGLLSSNSAVFNGMTEAKYGPDGALYIMARSGQYGDPKGLVSRIDYVGSCHDETFFSENRETFNEVAQTSSDPSRYRENFFDPNLYTTSIHKRIQYNFKVGEEFSVHVFDVNGKKVAEYSTLIKDSGNMPQWNGKLSTGDHISEGVYFLQFKNVQGNVVLSTKQVF